MYNYGCMITFSNAQIEVPSKAEIESCWQLPNTGSITRGYYNKKLEDIFLKALHSDKHSF